MKTNMGKTDRTIRVLVALVIAYLYFNEKITGKTAAIALSLSGIFLLTSLISFCPLYLPFGISTKGKEKK